MKNILFVLILGTMLYSCGGIKVITDKDPTIDFSTFKTLEYYGWEKNSDQAINSLDKKRIENAFRLEFEKRGMTLAKKDEGDIIVSLHIVTQKKTETVANTNTTNMGGYGGYGAYGMRGYGGYYGYGPSYGWGGGHSTSTTTYSEKEINVGTLIVSVYDAKKKELIWEGVGIKTLKENKNNIEKRITSSVAAIMYDYPVRAVKK